MSALQNPQVGNTTITLQTDAASQTYVVPFIANMYASAEATANVLQRANVTITGVDETFDLILSAENSVKLLNAFRIYKSDAGDIDGVLDTSAGVTVDMIGADEFKAALRAALLSAVSVHSHLPVNSDAAAAQCSIADYLKRETYVDTRDQLAYDTLANLLEASDLASFSMTLDVSGAALNMFNAMNDSVGANAARYRRTILTQLPESNVEAYLQPKPEGDLIDNLNAESITDIKFMPFISGDKLYFVFDAVVGEATADPETNLLPAPTTGATISRQVGDANYADKVQVGAAGMAGIATLAKNAAEYANGATLSFNAPTKRRIGVSVQVARNAGSPADKQPFNLLLKKGAESAVIDPSGAHFAYQVAAGLLHDISGQLQLTASAPSGTHSMVMPAAPSAAAIDLSGIDLSGGAYKTQVVLPSLPAVQASAGVFGAWLIVNAAGNANQFVLNGSNVEYRARIATNGATDSASLYYVSNVGKSGPVALSGGASYSTQA